MTAIIGLLHVGAAAVLVSAVRKEHHMEESAIHIALVFLAGALALSQTVMGTGGAHALGVGA